MNIDEIEVFHLGLPLRQPHKTALGTLHTLETVVVRLRSGGESGWGEACAGNAPLQAAEWAAGMFGCLKDWLAPALVGRKIDTGAALGERLQAVRGNQFAKAALDTAWWDLHARLDGKPLHQVLGGQRQAVEVGVGFDRQESIDEFLTAIGKAFEAGFARVELKLRPGWDINMLNVVRHEFGAETIHIDVEGALSLDHMETLCRLDDFMLAMVEQPLAADDLVGHAMIQEAIRTPICLDESVATPHQAEMALDLKSCQFVNLKPGRVGGLTSALQIHDACHDACTPCYVGGGPQTALAARAGLALAAKPNCTYPADWLPHDELLQQDLAPLPELVRGDDGVLRAPLWSEPGLGVEPEPEVLEKCCLAHERI